MSLISIGFSQADDPQEAAFQASVMIKSEFKNAPVHLAIVFASVHYVKKEVMEAIHTLLKPERLVGSSSAGLILSHTIVNRGLTIIAINSSTIEFGVGYAPYTTGEEFRQFGFELSRSTISNYKSNLGKQASLVFYDGLIPYDNHFILGSRENLGNLCPIIGTFSCDDFKFKRAYQFYQKSIVSRAAVGLLIGGSDASVAFSNKHGFKPLGKPRRITLTEGHIIHTIDDKPAVGIYEEFFKDETANLKKGFLNSPGVLYPLGIYLENQRQYLIRYPVDILSDGSIVCQADVPSDAEVHLMINNKDSCRQSAVLGALEIKDYLGGRTPQLVLVFESIIRHKILGRQLFTEIQAVKEILGQSVPIVGMYSFGEMCRLGMDDRNEYTYLQNASLLLVAIG